MTDAVAHDLMFHSTLMLKAGAVREDCPGTQAYAFTGFDAAGAVLLAVLQQPPAIADLARSLRLIFCISNTFLVIKQICPRIKPRFGKQCESYHRKLLISARLRFFTLPSYIYKYFYRANIIGWRSRRGTRSPPNSTENLITRRGALCHKTLRQAAQLLDPLAFSPGQARLINYFINLAKFATNTKRIEI
ncbi:hypothetical protein [Paraburkholderia ginsengisoli]|uniref:Uncharacterized protein n=1 Tax=Paraburkholderia ginsengisoli TaxID=311231 RepID=A0A7T4T8F8_9BURK|nr:hypothetical protein [Paraburkholderia ginsengisoli]QQC63857.1 hypothetical protein I6I06_16450 [Paraburkholderia ginsengisoli]